MACFVIAIRLAMWVFKLTGGRRRSLEYTSGDGDTDGAVSTSCAPLYSV